MTIKDSEYEELSKLDIGSWFGKEWKEETIPLLSEVLDLIPHKKEIYIEVKTGTEITDQLIKNIYHKFFLMIKFEIFGIIFNSVFF